MDPERQPGANQRLVRTTLRYFILGAVVSAVSLCLSVATHAQARPNRNAESYPPLARFVTFARQSSLSEARIAMAPRCSVASVELRSTPS